MNFKDIINNKSEILTKPIENILKKNNEYIIQIVNDIINVFNNKNKKILSCTFHNLGSYDKKVNLFTWSCDKFINNKEYSISSECIKKYSKKIKKYIINQKYNDYEYLEKMYYYLSNSIFYINPINIEDLLKISIFITKHKGILYNENNYNVVNYYIILDILSY
jgi:hypothetical protein